MSAFTTRDRENQTIELEAAGVRLRGDLVVPRDAKGVVLFAHGAGSGRASPRNREVARTLEGAGLATLLLDLLTTSEEAGEQRGGKLRFDVERLAARLVAAIDWLADQPATRELRLGLFGASTGAAAAVIAATLRPELVAALVSRGGRPDLAGTALRLVRCPTLLIVGGSDTEVLDLNRRALEHLRCTKELSIVSGASHLFEEPDALEEVARSAREWFLEHLRARAAAAVDPQGLQRSRSDLEC
jgi:putative phosphoribosyl transferase